MATITIEAKHRLTIPRDVPYSSEEASMSLSLEYQVDDNNMAKELAKVRKLQQELHEQIRLDVYAALGVAMKEVEVDHESTVVPDLSGLATSTSSTPSTQSSKRNVNIPKYTVKLGGKTVEVQDLRELKGTVFKANAPDFKIGDTPYWLKDRDGNVNTKAAKIAKAIAEASAPFEEDDVF